MGVQSFNDQALSFLGREHSGKDAWQALDLARKTFARHSFDMIYGLPDQSPDDWARTLSEGLSAEPDHLSLYQLTIEDGTAFQKAVDRGAWHPPDDDKSAQFFDLTQQITAKAGLPAYEISNHARPQTRSVHNLNYWQGGEYIGIGPGAHGRVFIDGTRCATETYLRPEHYLRAVEQDRSGASLIDPLDDNAQLTERLTMGLRLYDGISLYADDIFYRDESRVDRLHWLIEQGMLTHDCGHLSATKDGARLLNMVIGHLLNG